MDDSYGCPVSVRSEQMLNEWNGLMHGFLTHGASTPVHLKALEQGDPDLALVSATRGLLCLILGRSELDRAAETSLRKAEELGRASKVTDREEAYTDALRDYLSGFPKAAADCLDVMLARYPDDAFGHKMVHALRFIAGDQSGMRGSLEKVMDRFQGGHPASGYMHGCYAFALEETGDYDRAEKTGRRAVELARDDAWGTHAVAHVLDMTGRSAEGVEWLSGREADWQHCANFGFHLWWHLALFHLDRGNIDTVLDLYDRNIRHETTDDFRDISNGASLLMRLEFEGVDVGNRWQEMADICENRIDDACNVFADLHYMLALIGGDRREAAGRLLSRMHETGRRGDADVGRVTAGTGIPAASGLKAFRDGNYERAASDIFLAVPALQDIGGSHAQRDVFERIGIESAIRAGRFELARELLDLRRDRRDGAADSFAQSRYSQIAALSRSAEPARAAGMVMQF